MLVPVPVPVLAVAEVGVSVSHSFESIDALLRRDVFDLAYIKSRLKVLCPRGLINGINERVDSRQVQCAPSGSSEYISITDDG